MGNRMECHKILKNFSMNANLVNFMQKTPPKILIMITNRFEVFIGLIRNSL
ncbi:MAG: hypothetical protein K0R93_1350 [Anaerosolibacter sp.]|nr:hypothetical protein [Anaerosolibacter sp.]